MRICLYTEALEPSGVGEHVYGSREVVVDGFTGRLVPSGHAAELAEAIVDAALERDLPFLVEKPLAVDLRTAEDIAGAVERRGVVTAVGYHWRHLDIVQRARHLVAVHGPPRLALGYWLDARPSAAWWLRTAMSGGQLVEQTTHIFDLARLLVGDVTSVTAAHAHVPRVGDDGADVAATSVVTLRFASGALGTVSSTSLLDWPHRIGLHVACDELVVELSETELVVSLPDRVTYRASTDAVGRQDEEFLSAVRNGDRTQVRVPYGEALRTHRLAAASSAAELGTPVVVEPAALPPVVLD